MTQEDQKEFRFFSWQWNGFLAIILGGVLVYYTYITYGIGTAQIFERGTWLVLGGFSLFYPIGLFMAVFLLILTIGFIFNLKQVSFTTLSDGQLKIQEKVWGIIPLSTTIDLKAIRYAKFETGRYGNKLFWVFVLGTHAVYLLNDGLHLLFSPYIFGYGYENAIILIISGIVDLLMLLLIVLPGEEHLELHTDKEFHVLSFHLWRNRNSVTRTILAQVGFTTQVPQNEGIENFSNIPSAFSRKLTIYGSIFWIIALIARIFDIYAGTPLRLVLYFTGWACLLYGIKFRLSKHQSYQHIDSVSSEMNQIELHLKAIGAETHLIAKDKLISNEIVKNQSAHLPSIFMICILGSFLLMTWTIIAWIRFTWGIPSMIGYTLLFLGVDFILALLFLDLVFENSYSILLPFGSPDSKIKIPHICVNKYFKQEATAMNSRKFWMKWQINWRTHKSELKPIMISILISIIVGLLCAFV